MGQYKTQTVNLMKGFPFWLLLFLLLIINKTAFPQYEESNAYLVVTGMKLNETPGSFVKDPSFAMGATVKLFKRNVLIGEKVTSQFPRTRNGLTYYSADFQVALDSTYSVEMIYSDGTTMRIDSYRLPSSWKTHFYFHSTDGSLSASSILRSAGNELNDLKLNIFAVYPFANYKSLGGNQLITGIKQISKDTYMLKLFPNPAKSSTRLSFQLNSPGIVHLSVCNLSGDQIYQKSSEFPTGQNEWDLTLNDNFHTGVYFLTLTTEKESITRKLLVLESN